MTQHQAGLWKRFFSSRWFLVVGILILVLLCVAYSRAFYQNYRIRQEIKRLNQETQRLESKRFELKDTLEYVQSPGFVERKARTELNLMKEGENLVVVKGERSSSIVNGQVQTKVVESRELTNPEKWWNYFFGSYSINTNNTN